MNQFVYENFKFVMNVPKKNLTIEIFSTKKEVKKGNRQSMTVGIAGFEKSSAANLLKFTK